MSFIRFSRVARTHYLRIGRLTLSATIRKASTNYAERDIAEIQSRLAPSLDRRFAVLPRSHRGHLAFESLPVVRSPLAVMGQCVKWSLISLASIYLAGFILYAVLLTVL